MCYCCHGTAVVKRFLIKAGAQGSEVVCERNMKRQTWYAIASEVSTVRAHFKYRMDSPTCGALCWRGSRNSYQRIRACGDLFASSVPCWSITRAVCEVSRLSAQFGPPFCVLDTFLDTCRPSFMEPPSPRWHITATCRERLDGID